jgi:hypothetical protein
MITIFREIPKKCAELESLRILAQTGEIMYRQKGEVHTADRFRRAEAALGEAIRLLQEGIKD